VISVWLLASARGKLLWCDVIRHASREQVSKGKGLAVNRIVVTVCRGNMVQGVVVCGEFWAKKKPCFRRA
jgi:hypothetical protein